MTGLPFTSDNPEEMAVPTSSQECALGEEWPAQAYGGPAAPIFSEPGPVFQVDLTKAAKTEGREIDEIAPILIERHRQSLSELAGL